MRIKYLGHSAFLIESNEFKALIDPFISGNPLSRNRVEDFKDISHIFVSHGHNDHLGDTAAIAKNNNSTVISNFEIGNYLSSLNIKTHPMYFGGGYKFDFGKVKLVPASHGSSITTDKGIEYGGNPCGFLIEVNDKKIYHAGDTGLIKDMELLKDEKVDLALLPIGGNYTMDIEEAVKAANLIEAKLVVPMHYNTFPLIAVEIGQFIEADINSDIKVMKIGEEIEI